jgi:hypothetical protein
LEVLEVWTFLLEESVQTCSCSMIKADDLVDDAVAGRAGVDKARE